MLKKDILSIERDTKDDFSAKNIVNIDCGDSVLKIDWSKAAKDMPYVKWESR